MWHWGVVALLGLAAWQPPPEPAQTKGQPAAAPAAATASGPSPSPSPFPEGYLDQAALTAALRRVVAASSGKARLQSLAQTREGHDVWLVSVGQPVSTQRPAILIVANLEGDHIVGSQAALAILEHVLRDPSWEKRLAEVTLYVVPRLNPDGAERLLHPPRVAHRGNPTPLDRDRDGKAGEDGPDDLNGDGLISTMRVKDSKATLLPDPADPRILKKADPAKGEQPVYSEYAEGIDNDGDGLINEDPPGGVNLNRNWPFRWSEFDPEAGFSPAAEPETRALIQFAFDHPEIAVVWSFGLNDNLTVAPKKPESLYDAADLPLYGELSRLYGKATGRPKGEKSPASAPASPGATTDGAMSEWAYHQYGALGLASRLWEGPELGVPADAPAGAPKPPADPAAPATPTLPTDGEARWLYWNDRIMGGRAFLPLAALDHPALGKVEIGGWKPGVRLNPPIEQVAAIARAHQAFLGELADRLPRLALRDVKVEAKGEGIYQLTAAVVNEGMLPTALAQGVRSRKAPPVRLRLDPGPAGLLAGRAQIQFDSLGGSGGRREFRWLLLVPGPGGNQARPQAVTLSVSCPKAGAVVQTIPIGKDK